MLPKNYSLYLDIAIIVIAGLLIIQTFAQGANTHFDDITYLNLASQLKAGTYTITSNPYAYGSLFIASITVYPYISELEYLVIALIIYITLLKWFKPRIALTTTLCIELSAYIAIYTSRVLPDMLLGVLISLMFLIYAYHKESKIWMLISGFILGCSLFVKFGGVVLLMLLSFYPILIILTAFVLLEQFLKKGMIMDAKRASFITGIYLAILLYQLLLPHGASVISMAQNYSAIQAKLSWTTLQYNLITLYLMFFSVSLTLAQIFPLGLVGILAIIGTGLIIYKKEKRLYFVVLAFWGSVLYLFLGTESFQKYVLITVVSRYFTSFVAPMAILSAYAISYAYQRAGRYNNYLLFAIVVLTILTNLSVYLWTLANPNFNYSG